MKRHPLRDLLVLRSLFDTPTEAERWIMAGRVIVNGRKDAKPGERFPEDVEIVVKGITDRAYVTRGGLKLEAALNAWTVPVAGAVCLDVGCSVGGFTDCLLQHGASRVYAVDVGKPRLSPKLRRDSRVAVFEETNAASLPVELFNPPPTVAVIDVSYLAASEAALQVVKQCASIDCIIVLLKPIYELGRAHADLSSDDYEAAIEHFKEHVESDSWQVNGHIPSPIEGLKGAREYLIQISRK